MRRAPRISPLTLGTVAAVLMILVVVGVFVSGAPGAPQISLPGSGPVSIKADLAGADGLAVKDAVEIAGIKVGEVTGIEGRGDRALVTMSIERRYADVRQDARAVLRPHGLFGSKYVDLQPGTAGAAPLADGSTIGGNRTVQPVDLDQILRELDKPEQRQLQTAIVELGQAAAGRGSDVNQLIAAGNTLSVSLDSVARALDQVDPNLNDAIVQSESFNAEFAQVPLDQLVANSNVTLQAFARNADHLQSILDHADSTLSNLDQALNGRGGDLRTFLETAPATIDRLDTFSNLIGLFSANLTGQDTSVPGDTNAVPGVIAAIENPKSAFSGFDACNPKTDSDCPNFGPLAGQKHYLAVTAFQEALPTTSGVPGASMIPCLVAGIPTNIPGCNGGIGTVPSGAAGHAAPALPSGLDLSAMADFLAT